MQIDESKIREAIAALGVETKENGDEIRFRTCPYCETGGTKEPFAHFSVNAQTGLYNCLRVTCGAKGNIYRLMSDMGCDALRKAKLRAYVRPEEKPALLTETEKFYKWYKEKRGISEATLEKYGVGVEHAGNKRYIVYQYRDETGAIVNRKYRNAVDKKDMRTEKGCELAYYGAQFLNFADDKLFVCEGEDDCHALVDMGLENVVSVPSGATSYTEAMDAINARFKFIILLYDNDTAGQVGARKFAEKAGLHKCMTVMLPFKDARECKLQGMDIFGLQKEILKAKPFEYTDVVKAGNERDGFKEFIKDVNRSYGKQTYVYEFNRMLGGIRLKELSIVIGHTGSGKTTFALNAGMWAEEVGYPVLFLPFENRIESVLKKLVQIESGETLYTRDANNVMKLAHDDVWYDARIDALDARALWFLNKRNNKEKYGYYTIDKVEELIRYSVKFYDIKFVVVDHLHYFLKLSEAESPVLVIDEAMRRLKMLTEELAIHIMLIVHPNKTEDSKTGKPVRLGLNSGKGASSIAQECDNYFVVEKVDMGGKPVAVVKLIKNREIGTTGNIAFNVADNLNKYCECKPWTEKDESDAGFF